MKALYLILAISFSLVVGCSESTTKKEKSNNVAIKEESGEISIEGMSCMACVAKVKKTLSDIEGINEVEVSLENKNVIFQYNPQKISLDKIEQAINDIGYKAGAAKKTSE